MQTIGLKLASIFSLLVRLKICGFGALISKPLVLNSLLFWCRRLLPFSRQILSVWVSPLRFLFLKHRMTLGGSVASLLMVLMSGSTLTVWLSPWIRPTSEWKSGDVFGFYSQIFLYGCGAWM